MIESERLGPEVLAPGSLLPFGRRSEPSTRMLLADVSGKPDGSSTPATSFGGALRSKCELTRNSTSESSEPGEDQPDQAEHGSFEREPAPPAGETLRSRAPGSDDLTAATGAPAPARAAAVPAAAPARAAAPGWLASSAVPAGARRRGR